MQDVLILNQKLAHTFSYYELETGKELHRIRLPDFPHEFAVDSESRYAYVGHYGIETHMHLADGGTEIFVIDIARAERVRTNSYHHQAVDRVGKGLRIVGRSADGVVEAIEQTEGSFVLGVQWHPEMSFQAFPEQVAPFRAFMTAVEEASLVRA